MVENGTGKVAFSVVFPCPLNTAFCEAGPDSI